MDFRDFNLWMMEAQKKLLERRAVAYSAALLPHQKQEIVNRQMDELKFGLYEIEHGDEIDGVEKQARERLEKMKTRPKKKQGGRR